MSGNVWEWCSSLYLSYPYMADDDHETLIKNTGNRVLRGGSWDDDQHDVRAAYRFNITPAFDFSNIGLRVVCVPLLDR